MDVTRKSQILISWRSFGISPLLLLDAWSIGLPLGESLARIGTAVAGEKRPHRLFLSVIQILMQRSSE